MNANSPICASENPFWTAVLTSTPERSEANVLLKSLPATTTRETTSIAPPCAQSAAGSTRRPIDTKNMAENIDLSGSTSSASRSRTSLDAPMTPTRNAPRASEKLNR